MEFSLDLKSFAEPKKRLVIGILLFALGAVCILGQDWYAGVTKESCKQVEAVFKDCKYHSVEEGRDVNDIYLVFEDYGTNLDVHPSCADERLTQRLFDLQPGAKMKLLANEKTGEIYELEVEGDIWLDFDTAKEKIDNNVMIVKYAGFAALSIGGIFFITALIALIRKGIITGKK